MVLAKSFFNIVERMEENLDPEPPVGFGIYKTFSNIDFCKFEEFYSRTEWDSYYLKNKDVISKLKFSKHYVYPFQTRSHFD